MMVSVGRSVLETAAAAGYQIVDQLLLSFAFAETSTLWALTRLGRIQLRWMEFEIEIFAVKFWPN